MQRRVEQTNRHRSVPHLEEYLLKILLLQRTDDLQCLQLLLRRICQNHAANRRNARFVKKHMLGTAKSDPLRAEIQGLPRVARIIGIGSDLQLA